MDFSHCRRNRSIVESGKYFIASIKFQEWAEAGLFQQLWKIGLIEYDNKKGIV